MAKKTVQFVCQSCGNESSRWMGKCPACGDWNTLVEETSRPNYKEINKVWANSLGNASGPQPITNIDKTQEERFSSGIPELDRVLGGGFVVGSLGLIGGEPGIGKSTLLMQVACSIAERRGPVLYVSGEESIAQLKLRAERLNALHKELSVVTEANASVICDYINKLRPALVLIDSIQTMYLEEISSPPGSLGQVRECTGRFLQVAKSTGIPIVLVGHVTKGGSIAGPKVLEHAVDYVLYFEGDTHTTFRIVRGVKNRFGSTNEIAIFDMTELGLVDVTNPSEMFLAQRPMGNPGTIVVPCLEGTRPLLVEIQALVGPTAFGGTPRRQATGVDYQRFSIILAVLEKREGYPLQNLDVFVNAAGGLKLDEPAVDLGIAIAVASSMKSVCVDPLCAVVGELGLTGEIRAVRSLEQRLNELHKLGFTKCVAPKTNLGKISSQIEVVGVNTIKEALDNLLRISQGR